MNEKKSLANQIKGFFLIEASWIKKHFTILLLAITMGLICGLVMVGFNYLLILFRFGMQRFLPYFIAPIIAGLLTCLLVKFGHFDNIMGTGASEFVQEVNEPDPESRRIGSIFAKTFATSWTFGSGMVCGLEGPGLLIGANLGHIISKIFHQDKIDYYFIGASACTGALLKAPISGALFCAELPYDNYIRYKSLIPSLIASTVAFLIFCLFFEFTPLIQLDHFTMNSENTNLLLLLPLLVIFGIIAGLFALFFMGLLRGFTNKLQKTIGFKYGLWTLPLIGAIGYCVLLLILIPFIIDDYRSAFIGPDAFFLNFFVNHVHDKRINWIFLLILLLLFTMAIFLSIGTMNSAGVIMPLIIFGAILGYIFGILFYPEHPELFVLVGISAVLGATLKTPIAAIFLIIEMTWCPFLFVPAAITTIIAYIFSGPSAIVSQRKTTL